MALRLLMSVVVLAALAAHSPVQSQAMLGKAKVIDGDTLLFGDSYIRLYGIDAVESGQLCTRNGAAWQCGADAEKLLASLVSGTSIMCQQQDRDSYGRIVATCTANSIDLSQHMANAGFAVALPQYSARYVDVVEKAKAAGAGIWGGEFQNPVDYRAENPQKALPPPALPRKDYGDAPATVREANPRPVQAGPIYYRSCAAARAAGVTPLFRGSPGYRPQLDADGDGVACEPGRSR